MHFQELDGQREEHRGRQRVVGQRAGLPRHERVLVTGRQGAEDEGEREGVQNGPSPPQWARTAPRPLRARVEASSTMASAGARGCGAEFAGTRRGELHNGLRGRARV